MPLACREAGGIHLDDRLLFVGDRWMDCGCYRVHQVLGPELLVFLGVRVPFSDVLQPKRVADLVTYQYGAVARPHLAHAHAGANFFPTDTGRSWLVEPNRDDGVVIFLDELELDVDMLLTLELSLDGLDTLLDGLDAELAELPPLLDDADTLDIDDTELDVLDQELLLTLELELLLDSSSSWRASR